MRMGENWSRYWSQVVIVFALATIYTTADCGQQGILDPTSMVPCPISNPLMDPVNEVLYGQEVVWQIPPNPKGVLFVAHGSNQDQFGYFGPGRRCQKCQGLPEHRLLVLEALRRSFAVIAVKSIGNSFDRWPLEDNKDLVIVLRIIDKFRKEHSLESLPFVGFGHSGGGYFATVLSLVLPMHALLLSSCEGQLEVIESASPDQFPPTFFVYIAKELDEAPSHIAQKANIEKSMALLSERGVSVAGKECDQKPLYPHFFAKRIRCMTDEMSKKVYEAYKAEGWLDTNNFLTKGPYCDDWESVLRKWNTLPFCEKAHDLCLAPHVLQELKVAYGFHASISEGNEPMFSWLDSSSALWDPVLSASQ